MERPGCMVCDAHLRRLLDELFQLGLTLPLGSPFWRRSVGVVVRIENEIQALSNDGTIASGLCNDATRLHHCGEDWEGRCEEHARSSRAT